MDTNELLDRLKKEKEIPSEYALAKFLGVSQTAVQKYRAGGAEMRDQVALKVAEALDMDPGEVLAGLYAKRTKDPEVRKVWERLSKLAHTSLLAVLAVTFSVGSPVPAQATTAFKGPDIYLMRNPGAETLAGAGGLGLDWGP